MVIFVGGIKLTFFYPSQWEPVINIPLTVLWIVGLTNAMNFFDGIDGLSAGLSIISAFFLFIIAFYTHQPALGWFAIAILGACSGFIPHNFRFKKSALLFLGDAGSTFLGFTLAGLAVLGQWSNTSHFVSLSAPILIFGVLIFDMIYVTLSRIKNRREGNVFDLLARGNTDHLHHRLLYMGFARKEVVFIIFALATCLGVSALIIMGQKTIEAFLGLFQAVLIFGLIVTLMLKGRERKPPGGDRRVRQRRREDRVQEQLSEKTW
jgi:UDP-GlcNAc:undecaprenyl-phosphate GlcNAc-1-phosphate transferase